jgi:hypothetical protein
MFLEHDRFLQTVLKNEQAYGELVRGVYGMATEFHLRKRMVSAAVE